MFLQQREIERFVAQAGYDATTGIAVGVGSPSASPSFSQGVSSDGRPVDAQSVVYAGSLAKQMTGACAALYAQNGALDVEASIADWLTELPSWAARVRVRHLLHHTAGLPSTDDVWDRMTAAGELDWTSQGVLTTLSTIDEIEAEPGTRYAYSNVGYICLARILERLSGHPFAAVARTLLFEPLGMGATTLWSGPAPSPPDAALGEPLRSPLPLSLGDGGLWTSVTDLLRWNESLRHDTLGIARLLHTTGTLDDGTPLEYAWGVRVVRTSGALVQSHGGSWEDAAAKVVRLPEHGIGFAALALGGGVDRMLTLTSALQSALLEGVRRIDRS